MKSQKIKAKIKKCFEIGLYVSYRAQNLHAEIFLKVIWVLDRSKVSKVSKIKVYQGFLKVDFLDFMGGTLPHGKMAL